MAPLGGVERDPGGKRAPARTVASRTTRAPRSQRRGGTEKPRATAKPEPKRSAGRGKGVASPRPSVPPPDARWVQRCLSKAEEERSLFLYHEYLGKVEWLIRQFPSAEYPKSKVGEYLIPFLERMVEEDRLDELTETALKAFVPIDLDFIEAESGLPRNYVFAVIELLPEEVKALPPERQMEFVAIVLGLIHKESAFDEFTVSKAGAIGPLQVMPDTAQFLEERTALPLDDFEKSLPLADPRKNLKIGMYYLYRLYRQLGGDPAEESFFSPTMRRVLIAYNGGKGYLKKHSAQGVKKNQYQRKVMALAELYSRFFSPEIDFAWHLVNGRAEQPPVLALATPQPEVKEGRKSPFERLKTIFSD